MLDLRCSICDEELTEPAALLFSPPMEHDPTLTRKEHLCQRCYAEIVEFLQVKAAGWRARSTRWRLIEGLRRREEERTRGRVDAPSA